MGQKIRPNSLRLGIIENWRSRWWPKKNYREQLEEDVLIRRVIQKYATLAGIVRIDIERGADNAHRITLKVARPGLVIGHGGKGIEELSKTVIKALHKLYFARHNFTQKISVNLNVEELKRTEISAQYIAQSIAWDIEKRIGTRRTIKKYLDLVMQNRDVEGGKILVSGRIDGNEIARRETLSKGKLPLQTLRANIDYGQVTSHNTYGSVGIKVWVYKGEVFDTREERK
ncbi:MAG: 30S ribosomal protein S3 [Patescibacteria group bacterium]